MTDAKVFLFVDNSNVFLSAKDLAEQREGRFARDAVRIQFDALYRLCMAGRELGGAYCVGSIPPDNREIWRRLTAHTGIVPELYERGEYGGGEQGIDQCLQVHMLRALSDNPSPQVAVLVSGDGAGYDEGAGFHADLVRLHDAGWGIELVSWKHSCSRALRSWVESAGVVITLDDYYEGVTFLEGSRRSQALKLTTRPRAKPGKSQAESAAEREKARTDAEAARLQSEIDALRNQLESKERGRANFLKRQERTRRGRR